jgi:hypothetical protein
MHIQRAKYFFTDAEMHLRFSALTTYLSEDEA